MTSRLEEIVGLDPKRLERLRKAEAAAKTKPTNGHGAEPDWAAEVARLAKLHPVEYDRQREAAAELLACRVATLDREVARSRGDDAGDQGRGREVKVGPPELHPHPVAGVELATELAEVFRRFVALPEHADAALVLWVLHTHAFEASPITPRLAITSPAKRCGKTTVLEIVGALVAKPMMTGSITAAATFRTIEMVRPTLLVDEADTFLADAEELRGVINSGHRRTGEVIRAEERGGQIVPVRFATWAPVAIALIGRLPGTIEDRSVRIQMARRTAGEVLERWRCDRLDRFAPLVRKCARWAADHRRQLEAADPEIPIGLHDRAADNWRCLLTLADAIGGEWPAVARAAALALSGGDEADTLPLMLLSDLRELWPTEIGLPKPTWNSQAIVALLGGMEHRPWPEVGRGKPLSTTKLAALLRTFKIAPTRNEEGRFYRHADFADPWTRYLPPLNPSSRQESSN